VRRLLAISLLLLFGLPLAAPLFGAAVDEATLPACCRRDGKHHCAMTPAENAAPPSGLGTSSVREKCPYAPAAPALLLPRSFSPPAETSVIAQLAACPSVAARTETQGRISLDRGRQKRGPPAILD
jgi:hypothetical protein